MIYDFDKPIERRDARSIKWTLYPEDVLPLWVADMDFQAPEPVLQALRERVEHGIFGYQADNPALRELIVERFAERNGATISADQIVFLPGLVAALSLCCRIFVQAGEDVIMNTPIYPPFLSSPTSSGRTTITAPMAVSRDGATMRYEIDFDALEAAITPQTKLFLFCNPHNPVGRVYTRPELERLAEFVFKHDLLLVSDEIHCDLIFSPNQHITACAIAPELSKRLITLQAPSKTFNIAGIGCGFAVIDDEERRKQMTAACFANGLFPGNTGFTAAEAAYRNGEAWLEQLLMYLQANRDFVEGYLKQYLPQAIFTHVEGTYLGWIDFSAYQLPDGAYQFLLENAKVALNDGKAFGSEALNNFARINMGCSRATLTEALDRICKAITNFSQ